MHRAALRACVAGAICAALGLAPLVARAEAAIADELTVGGSKATNLNPRSLFIADKLSGYYAPSNRWAFELDATYTRDAAQAKPPGAAFGAPGGNVFLVSPIVTLNATERLAITVEGDLSPASVSDAPAAFTVTDARGVSHDLDAEISSRTQSFGGVLGASYDLPGHESPETQIAASVGLAAVKTQQEIVALAENGTTATRGEIAAFCAKTGCPPAVSSFLAPHPSSLLQVRFGLGAMHRFSSKTEVTVAGSYYVYDKDPTTVGYFSLYNLGRTSASFGGGVAIAPVLFTAGPVVVQPFGPFSAGVSFQYGQYVAGQGHNLTAGVKLGLEVSKRLRLWLAGNGQRDVDANAVSSQSGTLAAGAKLGF